MTEIFILKAKKIHKELFDYSLVEYKNNITKVKIICKTHGVFEQTPQGHLVGKGCNQCAKNKKKKTTEQFIQEAINIHGDKYDYSLVDYKTTTAKIKITCKVHGVFEQIPKNHISGIGCNKCHFDSLRKTTEQFINEATNIHGDKYDYSLVDYKQSFKNVKIVCKIHGLFEQTPNCHIAGSAGCRKCANDSLRKTTEQFINEATNIHGDKYDYSLVDYKQSFKNVKIVCKIHGLFEQTPDRHLAKNGCPHCYNKTEGLIKNFLVENGVKFITQCKIDDKKFDFLINNDYILEIDGPQHFPHLKNQDNRLYINRNKIIENDILKMKSIINYYPIVRLFQENIWNGKYNWKTLLLNLKGLEPGNIYVRSDEKNIYKDHITEFDSIIIEDRVQRD